MKYSVSQAPCSFVSVYALIAPEEEGDRTRTGMTSDGRPDTVDEDLAVKLREILFDEIRNCSRILIAGGIRDIAFSGVIRTVFSMLDHLIHDRLNDFLLRADLIARNQTAEVINVHERADIKKTADETGCLGDSATPDEEGEV